MLQLFCLVAVVLDIELQLQFNMHVTDGRRCNTFYHTISVILFSIFKTAI